MTSLGDKIAIVTGGGSGIGAAVAVKLAQEGAIVVIGDRNEADACRIREVILEAGGHAEALLMDVTEPEDVTGFFAFVTKRYGRLDIAINNAGISKRNASFMATDEPGFDETMAVNLKGVWRCMVSELAVFLRQGDGVIVNMASALGLIGAAQGAAYVASKHAVVGLTKAAAVEFAAAGIRVNAVCPGVINTPLVTSYQLSPAELQGFKAVHPVGRLGTVEEVANAVFWLASPAASFVTGATLAVDGGWTAW